MTVDSLKTLHSEIIEITKAIRNENTNHIFRASESKTIPYSATRVLRLLKRLTDCLEKLMLKPSREREASTWLILNITKLIVHVSTPLIFLHAGKYVMQSLILATLPFEIIVNLGTVRHLKLRTKIYSLAFYCLITQLGGVTEAENILTRARVCVREMKEREELDPPIPDKTVELLLQAETDMNILSTVLSMWKDPDAFDLSDTKTESSNNSSFIDRCLCEMARVQQLSGDSSGAEKRKKRSSALVRVFWKHFEALVIADDPASSWHSLTSRNATLSLGCISELAVITMFDGIEGVPVSSVLEKTWAVVDSLSEGLVANDVGFEGEYGIELLILRLLQKFERLIEVGSHMTSSAVIEDSNRGIVKDLAAFFNTVLAVEKFPLIRPDLLRRFSVGIWAKFLYPAIQSTLSLPASEEEGIKEALTVLSPICLSALRALEMTDMDDPVLLTSFSSLTAILLNTIGDKRSAISLLKKSLGTLNDHRAARVDVTLHVPHDARDVSALMRASISANRDTIDWQQSVLRPAARASGGCGIAGAGSGGDTYDLTLADLHTVVLAQYFRLELEYALMQKLWRQQHHIHTSEASAASSTSSTSASVKATKPTSAPSVALVTQVAVSTLAGKGVEVDAAKLNCVSYLTSHCAKDVYAKSLLYMEMAKIDTDEKRRKSLLKEALNFIAEAETREFVMLEAFSGHVSGDVEKKHDDAKSVAPVVLSRSHNFIILSPLPVAAARQKENAEMASTVSYYRVFAKEQGENGTKVNSKNSTFPGSEVKIFVKDMMQDEVPSLSAVKIEGVRSGERYVLACCGFTEEGAPVKGSLSATTVGVEAVNPLPTPVLWSALAQAAYSLELYSIGASAASKVCRNFFVDVDPDPVVTVGKGLNLFGVSDSVLNMLRVQQASAFMLERFIVSYVIREEHNFSRLKREAIASVGSASETAHWNMRSSYQKLLIAAIRQTAAVSSIAVLIKSHDLILRSVILGAVQLGELLKFDECDIACMMLPSAIVFLHCLQSTPRSVWLEQEHTLYCRLLIHCMRMGVYSRNCAALSALLRGLFTADNASHGAPAEAGLRQATNPEYVALLSALRDAAATGGTGVAGILGVAVEDALKQISTTLCATAVPLDLAAKNVLWVKHTVGERVVHIDSIVKTLKSDPENIAAFQTTFRDPPVLASELLSLIVHICRELSATAQYAVLIGPVLQHKVRILDIYIEKSVLDTVTTCGGLDFIVRADSIASAQPTASGRKSPRSAKGAAGAASAANKKGKPSTPTTDDAALSPEELKERYNNVSAAEKRRQFSLLAELALLSCPDLFSTDTRSNFPISGHGPLLRVDPSDPAALLAQENIAGATAAGEETSLSARLHDSENQGVENSVGAVGAKSVPSLAMNESFESKEKTTTANSLLTSSRLATIKNTILSVVLFCEAGEIGAACKSAVKLWNFLNDNWIDPITLSTEVRTCVPFFSNAIKALTAALERVSSIISGGEKIDVDQQLLSSIVRSKEYDKRSLKEYLFLVRELLIYGYKVIWLNRDFHVVVDFGEKTIQMFIRDAPEYRKLLGDSLFPLILHAQREILNVARAGYEKCKEELGEYVHIYEEAKKRQRKKVLRIAKLEKDDDEIRFELGKARLEDLVNVAKVALDNSEERLRLLEYDRLQFESLSSTGAQILDKVRGKARLCIRQFNEDESAMQFVEKKGPIRDFVEGIIIEFEQLASFLRDKKDRHVLLEALNEQASFLLTFGRVDAAKRAYLDAIDGFFNTMDACSETMWKQVADNSLSSMDRKYIVGVLPAVCILGKLSRYCSANEWDNKSNYCQLASAAISRVLFQESVGHPETLAGFAAYECFKLGGIGSLAVDSDASSPESVVIALEEIVSVLSHESLLLAALPVIVLLEHYCAVYLRNAPRWLSARCKRIALLLDAHLFSQAAAMLASVVHGIQATVSQTYHEPLLHPNTVADILAFDTSANALNFHSAPAFYQHLSPIHEKNKPFFVWIEAFPTRAEEFLSKLTVTLPPHMCTPDDIIPAAAAVPAKGTKKAPAATKQTSQSTLSSSMISSEPQMPLFGKLQAVEVSLLCARFVLSVNSLEKRFTSVPHAEDLSKRMSAGKAMLDATLNRLDGSLSIDGTAGSRDTHDAAYNHIDPFADPAFMSLYGQCQIASIKYFMHRRSFEVARAMTLAMVQVIQGFDFSHESSGSEDDHLTLEPGGQSLNGPRCVFKEPRSITVLQYRLSELWMTAKDLLIDIAEKQGRAHDSIIIASRSQEDAVVLRSSYWERAYVLRRALLHFKAGLFVETDADLNKLFTSYDRRHAKDLGLVRALCLKANLLRESTIKSSKKIAASAVKEGIQLLQRARDVSFELARNKGFFGVNSNTTFTLSSSSAILAFDVRTPALHRVSQIESNEYELSRASSIDQVMLEKLKQVNFLPESFGEKKVKSLSLLETLGVTRLSPIDEREDAYVNNEFCNIYLPEVCVIAVACTALCNLVDDARNSGSCSSSGISVQSSGGRGRKAQVKKSKEQVFFNSRELLQIQLVACEDGLKALRHILFVASPIRLNLLLYAGKARRSLVALSQKENVSAGIVDADVVTRPLLLALNLSVFGRSHPWETMISVCVQLMESFADPSPAVSDETSAERMKIAAMYLITAIKIRNQLAFIRSEVDARRAGDATVIPSQSVASTELKQLLQPSDKDDAVSGALCSLDKLITEQDKLWLDGHDASTLCDLHALLKKDVAVYAQRCALPGVPDSKAGLVVALKSISTLHVFSSVDSEAGDDYSEANLGVDRALGIHSHLTVYFLLGFIQDDDKQKKPVLAKAVLYRSHVLLLEDSIRRLIVRFDDAFAQQRVELVKSQARELGILLSQLSVLLKRGYIDHDIDFEECACVDVQKTVDAIDADSRANKSLDEFKVFFEVKSPSEEVAPSGDASTAVTTSTAGNELAIRLRFRGTTIFDFPDISMTKSFMEHLADVFSPSKSMDALVNGDICLYLHVVLGYLRSINSVSSSSS